ncbi:MAG: hypothetical protein APR63_00630 [Desulfuromonas sp. SDB]|nr:MAG: hypothetical protein APR63_00630 [Desulfuromonas sp. SDB]
MKKELIFLMLSLMMISSITAQISPGGDWSHIYTNLEGKATDLEKINFGYAFTCGSGSEGSHYSFWGPTTLVAADNWGNIIWQITNEDLICDPGHEIVFASHKYGTNHYMFLIAGFGDYQGNTAMHLWPVIAIKNNQGNWVINSLPVNSYDQGYNLYPSDIIYYDYNYFVLSGYGHNSRYTLAFLYPIYFDGSINNIIQCSFWINGSHPKLAKIDVENYVMTMSHEDINGNNYINLKVYDTLSFTGGYIIDANLTPPLNQYRYYDVQSVFIDNDELIIGSVVEQNDNFFPNIIKTNVWGYLLNSYSRDDVDFCDGIYAIKNYYNDYQAVGGLDYPDDPLVPGYHSAYYMKLNSDFSFNTWSEYYLNMSGSGPSDYVELADVTNGQVYLGTYTTDYSNPDCYYPYLKFVYNLEPDQNPPDYVVKQENQLLTDFSVQNNQYNINFSFNLEHESNVNIAVYDVQGRNVANLLNSSLSSGGHNISWDKTDNTGQIVHNGCYIFRMTGSENLNFSNKFLIIE